MTKPPGSKSGESERASYVGALIKLLKAIDLEEGQRAARALGEAGDPAAIKPLMAVVKGTATLRAAAIAALKKLGTRNEQAWIELASALLEEGREPAGEPAGEDITQADRRRAPRVLLEIPVLVQWREKSGEARVETSMTKVVNAYGALITLKTPVQVGLPVEITNLATQAKAAARVLWVGNPTAEGTLQVGIELGTADAEFWVGERA